MKKSVKKVLLIITIKLIVFEKNALKDLLALDTGDPLQLFLILTKGALETSAGGNEFKDILI